VFDLQPTEAQQMIVETARQFAARVLAPRARQLDVEGGFPRESLREAADLGLLGINVPEALGGVEAGRWPTRWRSSSSAARAPARPWR
jgi:alkylation response protein AidB-like acyl-CoA dehydrogenase